MVDGELPRRHERLWHRLLRADGHASRACARRRNLADRARDLSPTTGVPDRSTSRCRGDRVLLAFRFHRLDRAVGDDLPRQMTRIALFGAILAALGVGIAAALHAEVAVLGWLATLAFLAVAVAAGAAAKSLRASSGLIEDRHDRGPSMLEPLPPDVVSRPGALGRLWMYAVGAFAIMGVVPFVALARRPGRRGTAWSSGAPGRLTTSGGHGSSMDGPRASRASLALRPRREVRRRYPRPMRPGSRRTAQCGSFDEVDRRPQRDPDDENEMPVIRDRLDTGLLIGLERRSSEKDRERGQQDCADEHMREMRARQHVKDGAIGVRVDVEVHHRPFT